MGEKGALREAAKLVTLCVAWYSFSAANNVLGKKIFAVLPYPLTLSMTHQATMAALLGPTLAALKVTPAPHISRRFYFRRIVPLAAGKLIASASSHLSILKVSVSYAHTGEWAYFIGSTEVTREVLAGQAKLKAKVESAPSLVQLP